MQADPYEKLDSNVKEQQAARRTLLIRRAARPVMAGTLPPVVVLEVCTASAGTLRSLRCDKHAMHSLGQRPSTQG